MRPHRKAARKTDVLAAIRRMGALQIDTINVVARSPYLVLWSRLGNYDPSWLDQLLAEGELFEYWSHAGCFLPIEDYPLYQHAMATGHPRHREWLTENSGVVAQVLDLVREKGEVKSADFKRATRRSAGWWDWKPEKLALECLFTTGQLMIARRDGFQRYMRCQKRSCADASLSRSGTAGPTFAAKRAIRALGVARSEWVPDYFRLKKTGMRALLEECVEAGELLRVEVPEWNQPAYVHPDNAELAVAATKGRLRPQETTLLSPFDPVVWDRQRAIDFLAFTIASRYTRPANCGSSATSACRFSTRTSLWDGWTPKRTASSDGSRLRPFIWKEEPQLAET